MDSQAIAYTAYFFVSITLALELMGGTILQEVNEMGYIELENLGEGNIAETLVENNQVQSPFVDLIDSFQCINSFAEINPILESMPNFSRKSKNRSVQLTTTQSVELRTTRKSVSHGTLFLF